MSYLQNERAGRGLSYKGVSLLQKGRERDKRSEEGRLWVLQKHLKHQSRPSAVCSRLKRSLVKWHSVMVSQQRSRTQREREWYNEERRWNKAEWQKKPFLFGLAVLELKKALTKWEMRNDKVSFLAHWKYDCKITQLVWKAAAVQIQRLRHS